MSEPRTIPLVVKLDRQSIPSRTMFMWAGPLVLVIETTLSGAGLALELTSAFVGRKGVPTLAAHVMSGPAGHAPVMRYEDHAHRSLDPKLRVRECAYEHVAVVLEHLRDLRFDVTIDVADDAFDDLERAEG
jgi:hypothetical protein